MRKTVHAVRGRKQALATAFVLAAGLVLSLTAPPDVEGGSRIVNGLKTQSFPTTGALLYSGGAAITASNASTHCSGTLIGCRTFLTAAHCVRDDTAASHYWVYLQHGGLHAVSSIAYHPNYNPALSGRDVAIVKLAADVTGIVPTPINSVHNLSAIGTGLAGTIAGFGRTGGGSDYGIKRQGAVVTANCDTTLTDGEGNNVLVCWNYDSTVGAPGTDSNTCNGDSGGPLFMEFSGTTKIVGVTSAGSTDNCGPGDHSWDASVYYNSAWIAGQLGADSTSACGSIPSVGSGEVTVHSHSGALGSGTPTASFEVTVGGAPQLLRFTLNGTDNGSFNPNFFVKQGSGAGPSSYSCKADAASVFGACQFSNPAPGTWSVYVQRVSGSGEYQVTATVFGGDPPTCGDSVRAGGEECDGSDDASCPGACLGDCTCPAPSCGDDVATGGEQCDGSDDGACPGSCLGNCTCPLTCSDGPLYGLSIASNARRFAYRAQLRDPSSAFSSLDPTETDFELSITDGAGLVDLAIPAAHSGWIKADPLKRRYTWKGDGSLDGLMRLRLLYRSPTSGPYWLLNLRGRQVPGAASLDVSQVLDFRLGFDGTCHLESW
jgi:hypothetical protein